MIEKVFEEIQEDITWRNLELSKIKNIALNLNDTELKIFLKSILPLLYAHWEGFIVVSLKIVFKFLNTLHLSSNDYCDVYLTTAYEQTLKSLDNSTGFDKRKKHLINLYKTFKEQVMLDSKVDTKSNLNFGILEEICKKINLDINKFTTYKEELNELVNIRNSISHGENSYNFESYDDIQKYLNLLKNLMLDFESEIQDLLKNKKYLKEQNEQPI
jgi:hypothetical protein